MKDVPVEKLAGIIRRAHQLRCKDLGPLYIAAAIMEEAEATPAEMVAYMDEHFMETA